MHGSHYNAQGDEVGNYDDHDSEQSTATLIRAIVSARRKVQVPREDGTDVVDKPKRIQHRQDVQ